ncbi:hypothetical protein [Nonomuraea sp. NPDC049141]|uniref:hypothetical protein n=1 Tax=Nonomuraea sp. NPDC049141 TaxID=3155500 RepID=UPI0033F2F9FC
MIHNIATFKVTGHPYTVAYDTRQPSNYTIFHEDNAIGTFTHLPYTPALEQEVEDLARKQIVG